MERISAKLPTYKSSCHKDILTAILITSCCLGTTCPSIQNPLNGELVGDDFSVNSTVQFVCNAGYAVRGSSKSTCLLQGMWSHDPPTCQSLLYVFVLVGY